MKIRVLSLTLMILFARLAVASAVVELHSFQDVESYLKTHPTTSMDEVISLLSPELRSSYQLVYESRSAIQGSLKSPRVILSNKDKTKIIAFGGDANAKNGMHMEFMEQNPETKKLELKLVDFSNRVAQAHSNPGTCVACHASKGISGKKILRPIWDTYPDWPGVYGSSHNDYVMERGKSGVSGIMDLDFEKESFENFKKSATTHPRYQHLMGLNDMTLEKLAGTGTKFSDRLIGLNHQSTYAYIEDAIEQIRKNPSAKYRLRKAEEINLIYNQYFTPKPLKTFTEKEIKTLRDQFLAEADARPAKQLAHYESKLKRLRKMITQYGHSANDLHSLATLDLINSPKNLNGNFKNKMQVLSALPRSERAADLRLEKLLDALELDRGASSIAFEPFASVASPGDPDNFKTPRHFQDQSLMMEEISVRLNQKPLVTEAEISSIKSGAQPICNVTNFIRRLIRKP